MAISTPVSGRVRITYMGDAPDLRISGIDPLAQPAQITDLVLALQGIQSPIINDGYLYAEFELSQD